MSNNCSDFSDGIQLPCNYCTATDCHQNQQSWKKLAITMTNLTFTCKNDQKATSCVDAGGIWLHYPLAPKFSVIWWLGSVIMTNNVPYVKDKQTIHSSCLTYNFSLLPNVPYHPWWMHRCVRHGVTLLMFMRRQNMTMMISKIHISEHWNLQSYLETITLW